MRAVFLAAMFSLIFLSGTSFAVEPVAVKPLGSPATWVLPEDYPSEALENERTGVTRFKLTVNEEGLVSDCVVTQSSGTDELDFATCSLITQRARFSPALDERGKPTAGTFSSAVRWAIPEEMPPPQAMSSTRSYIVEVDGSVSNCQGFDKPPPTEIRSDGCPRWQFEPYFDANDKPVRKRVRWSETYVVEDVP